MNQNNTRKLIKKFSHLYRYYRRPSTESSMCFGFQCGDGWFNLLWELSSDIDKTLKRVSPAKAKRFAVTEVKEKFGGLRYCVNYSTFDISYWITRAIWKSLTVCMLCGKPGDLRRGLRNLTLCDQCHKRPERRGQVAD